MENHTPPNENERKEVADEFIRIMEKKFKSEEAEGISFVMGNFINNYDIGIIFTIDDGRLFIQRTENKEEIEKCDLFLFADLDLYTRLDKNEIALSELLEKEGEKVYFGGDMGLIYELYNIFDLPA
jgi:hypothetical protein